ncbi:uncharacterized protein LOC111691658 [Anoplophora glabripennis]|uniref:uncharacterized protein LOC111691658 n=1 Tax=Anoplophora glabripennis TaxID=217634 RepID=UPI0008738E3B|nr:uncharacterized protein LOC111691658 [Anoplophora glabripennis]
MKLTIFSIFVIFCAYLHAAKAADGVYEIIDGDCNSALARDQVYHEHVHKTRLPLVSREAKSSWTGSQRIYCLKVLNDKDESKGATCKVTAGGVGSTNVTIEMNSAKNHGLEFDIQIYAR